MNKLINKTHYFLIAFVLLVASCAKESSFETGKGLNTAAAGTLKDSLSSCRTIIVKGSYAMDSILTDSNYIIVTANITKGGIYNFYTDTVNGMWFKDSSFILNTGVKSFILKGYGKPIVPNTQTFKVYFNTDSCTFSITTTGTLGGGVIVVPPITSTDYLPLNAGTNWTYTSNRGDITYTVSNFLTAPINSKQYSIVVSDASDTTYYRKDNAGNYYTYSDLNVLPSRIERIMLKDNVAAGVFWDTPSYTDTYTQPGVGTITVNYKIRDSIELKNSTLTLNGLIFSNVIKVKTSANVTATLNGVPFDLGVSNDFIYNYYAKGIGMIKYIEPGYTEELKTFQIR